MAADAAALAEAPCSSPAPAVDSATTLHSITLVSAPPSPHTQRPDGSTRLERSHSDDSLGSQGHKRVMGVVALVSVLFFNVCGGPFGAEEIVSSGGPMLGLLSLLIFPWLWSIPMAALSSELSTAFPCDGGAIVWVTEAFGPAWGFQVGGSTRAVTRRLIGV